MEHLHTFIPALLREYAAQEESTQGARIPLHFIRPVLENVVGEQVLSSAILDTIPRAFIVGGAGAGKTTLLRWLTHIYLARCSGSDMAWPCACYIPARDFRWAETPADLLEAVRDLIAADVEASVTVQQVSTMFHNRTLALLIDGVDEVGGEEIRLRILEVINDFARQHPHAFIVVASRPASLSFSFPGFEFLKLVGFSDDQTARVAAALSPDQPEIARSFLQSIAQSRVLSALTKSPLLLELLFGTYEVNGRLPDNLAELYSDFSDYLLTTWESKKKLGSRSTVSVAQKHSILEGLSELVIDKRKHSVNFSDVASVVRSVAGPQYYSNAVTNELVGSGLLRLSHSHRVSFMHLSFAEYYRARSLVRDPARLYRLAGRNDAQQIILFAAGLIDDVAPLVSAAVGRGQLLLAAKCISYSRSENAQLIAYVTRAFADEVGERFLSLLSSVVLSTLPSSTPEMPDVYEDLLQAWDSFSEVGLQNHEKGRRFETFASKFFSTFFSVVNTDLHTENGELDLVLEVVKLDPFWMEFGSHIFVECKNTQGTPLKDVAVFRDKSKQANVKLGFFVSLNGFTNDAVRTLKNSVGDPSQALIVPLAGDDLKTMLLRREGFEEFFKKRVRDFKLQRKY